MKVCEYCGKPHAKGCLWHLLAEENVAADKEVEKKPLLWYSKGFTAGATVIMNSPYGQLKRGKLVVKNGTRLKIARVRPNGTGIDVIEPLTGTSIERVPEHWLTQEKP